MASALRTTNKVSAMKNTQSTRSGSASRQFRMSVAGNNTQMKTNAAKFSRKNDTHSHHSVSVPVSMIFICRPEWAPEW